MPSNGTSMAWMAKPAWARSNSADLLSALVDEVLIGYFLLVEMIERDIDDLDERALHGRPKDDVLGALVSLRRRIGLARRTLAPHRQALAALARPEMQSEDAVGQPWPGLVDRLEGAIAAIDSVRDSLLGTYDIHMGRVSQHANDVMKTLTLLSGVLLPAVVLAGIMGMNFGDAVLRGHDELLDRRGLDDRDGDRDPGRGPLARLDLARASPRRRTGPRTYFDEALAASGSERS